VAKHRNFVLEDVIKEAIAIDYGYQQVRDNNYADLPPNVQRPPFHAVAWKIANGKRKNINTAYRYEKADYKAWHDKDYDGFRTKIQAGKFKSISR